MPNQSWIYGNSSANGSNRTRSALLCQGCFCVWEVILASNFRRLQQLIVCLRRRAFFAITFAFGSGLVDSYWFFIGSIRADQKQNLALSCYV
ncbi:hypothetical protein [Paraburkholderia sp. GAS348]|uniref:hypothetical protein n=1 Tax=Paraburkholderia sp. GAS348 TaxID=3035132 RepID=UPI003D1F749B